MNRGIARRTLFEQRDDMRFFLASLARRVRAGELELHAWCLLPTHFHLLVRSPAGRLASAMHRLQMAYSRRFNRRRRRDGPLVRSRYRSKPVNSLQYRWVLVAYIDANPVQAGLVPRARDYPWSSAGHYARAHGPRWMERSWVEDEVRVASKLDAYDPRHYEKTFHESASEELLEVIESRLARHDLADPLDELVGAAPARILDWMRRKALLADGTSPGLPVAAPGTVERTVAMMNGEGQDGWRLDGPRSRSGWTILQAAALHTLCGLHQQEIAARLGLAQSAVSQILSRHRRAVSEDPLYAGRITEVARRCLGAWPGPMN